jgi:hypothetical protein
MTAITKGGVEVSGELIGRSERGLASATEHLGRHLAVPCRDHERKRQQEANAAPDTSRA